MSSTGSSVRLARAFLHRIRPEHWLIIAITISLAAWYEWSLRRITSPGFPLDDPWIHLQFARNLVRGEFAFNSGEPSAGITAPLWTFLLAIPALLHGDPITTTKLLGVVLTVVTALGAYQLALEASTMRLAGVSAGIAVAASSRVTWGAMSGMENALYAALATLTCVAYLRFRRSGRGSTWGALAGAAGMARPEVFVLFPILAVFSVVARENPSGDRRALWKASLWFALCVGAFILINVATDGRPLPNTFYAKTGSIGSRAKASC
jgi:hypothetical protein